MSRQRWRELGFTIGRLPTGPHNAITDVQGVQVGHQTVIQDEPQVARTGITVIVPRSGGAILENHVFAGFHALNGCGEMTGTHWLTESGTLISPIALTGTTQVGLVKDALIQYSLARYGRGNYYLGVVAETWDGWLHDSRSFVLQNSDLFAALDGATSGPVAEGNVGGGTGMICHEFKGGIGTSSRVVNGFTVGVLVQSNYGLRRNLRVNGRSIGLQFDVPLPWPAPPDLSSLVVILATDAPLLPMQCRRLAQRATIGAARVGCEANNGSGDLLLAFATGNDVPITAQRPFPLTMLPNEQLNPLFEAASEATEEAILNALTMAETMSGRNGHTAYAIPLDHLVRLLALA